VTIIVVGVVGTAGGAFLLWAAWWIYRGTPQHSKHHTTLPTVAAHHPLPKVIAGGGELYDLDEVAKEFGVDLGPDTDTWPAPRHTHRDPTTGRFVTRDKL